MAERPAEPRIDPGLADLDTQVGMGWQPPPTQPPAPPAPAPAPSPAPAPVPTSPAQEAVNTVVLDGALLEAGIAKTSADQTAVQRIARLDQATVATVAAWIKRGKREK